MSRSLGKRVASLALMACCAVAGQIAVTQPASAVTVAKGELKNGQLKLEGHSAPNIFVIARSTTSAAGIRADLGGTFKIQASDFTAPDCKVTIDDRQTPTATFTLAGCTPSVVPVPPNPAPPTGSCVITPPQGPSALTVGTSSAVNFTTTGCNTTFNSGATPTPVQWSVVAGVIPTGMTGPQFQGLTGGNIAGTPSIRGTYTFTVQVSDQVNATDQETFTVVVG